MHGIFGNRGTESQVSLKVIGISKQKPELSELRSRTAESHTCSPTGGSLARAGMEATIGMQGCFHVKIQPQPLWVGLTELPTGQQQASQGSVQTFTYSAATLISCIKRDGISQHYWVQMPGESLWEGLPDTAELPGFPLPKSLLSLFLPGHSGITDQLSLFPACLHTDNLPSCRVVNGGGSSSPRKMTSYSILASR